MFYKLHFKSANANKFLIYFANYAILFNSVGQINNNKINEEVHVKGKITRLVKQSKADESDVFSNVAFCLPSKSFVRFILKYSFRKSIITRIIEDNI